MIAIYRIQMKCNDSTDWKDSGLRYTYVPEDTLFVSMCTMLFEESGCKSADFRIVEIKEVISKVHKTINSEGMAEKLTALNIEAWDRRKSRLLAEIKEVESYIETLKGQSNG